MFKNYLKIAFRNLFKNKTFTFINVAGLSLGISSCILISLYVLNETSYDKHHSKSDRIFRVKYELELSGVLYNEASIPFPAAEAILKDFPEVENTVRIYRNTESSLIRFEDKKHKEENILLADKSLFKIFDFDFIYGSPGNAFDDPASTVITLSTSKKYFGDINPLGKLIQYDDHLIKISGVIGDIPSNSHFKFDFVVPLEFQLGLWEKETGNEGREKKWFWSGAWTYLLLKENQDHNNLNKKFPGFVTKYFPDRIKAGAALSLQPLTDIHLYSNLDNELEPTSSILYVYTFSAVAFFVLLIASINFVNLSTARYLKRIREIGVRKVLGASSYHLINQVFLEIVLSVALSFTTAFIIAELLIPFYSNLTGVTIAAGIMNPEEWILYTSLLFFLVILLSGVYPAFYVLRINPASSVKKVTTGGMKENFRKVLVVSQFSVSIALLISVGIIIQQIHFIKDKNLGFNKENVIFIKARPDVTDKFEAFKNDLQNYPGITSVSAASSIPGEEFYSYRFVPEGTSIENPVMLPMVTAEYDFLKTLSVKIKAGRDISKDYPTDASEGFILNETAARMLGWNNEPVGKRISLFAPGTDEIGMTGKVIGIMDDFHFESLHHEVKPLVLSYGRFIEYYVIRINPRNIEKTISSIEQLWKNFSPDWPAEYSFLDNNLLKNYKSEQNLQDIINYLTVLAVIIACLGLFGLSSFIAEQRTKEIGIRKVLGASVQGIAALFTKEFLSLVLLANIIAWPVAWYFMNSWLNSFAYRIDISPGIFFIAGGLAIIIALLTVSFQAVKAATANPVKSLKYE